MDDIDAELLDLMGDEPEEEEQQQDKDSEHEPEKPSRKRTSPPTSQSPASKKTKTSESSKGVARSKRRKDDSDDEESDVSMEEETDEEDAVTQSAHRMESDSESEDEAEQHPYPLEGKYRDEADKAALMAMSEIDREAVLAERATQIERLQQSRELRSILSKSRSNASGPAESTRRSTRAQTMPAKGKDATKAGQLAEIKRSRDTGGLKKATGDSSDAPKLLDVQPLDDDDMEENKPEREVTVDDINKARMGRTAFHKLLDYPGFEKAATGCFVRVSLWDSQAKQNIYRIAMIKGFTTGKPYDLKEPNRRTDQYLRVIQGNAERSFPMDMMSDKPFTESEFRRFKAQMEYDKVPFPTLSYVLEKKQDLIDLDNYKLTPEELEAMLQKRQRFKVSVLNLTLKRSDLQHSLRTARRKNDWKAVAELEQQIADLEREMNRGQKTAEDKMLEINEQIKRENRQKIREAEIAEKRARREAAINPNKEGYDPFQRVKTKVKTMHETLEEQKRQSEQKVKDGEEKLKAEEKDKEAKANGEGNDKNVKSALVPGVLSGDALIASLDLGIDDDLDLGDDTVMSGDVY